MKIALSNQPTPGGFRLTRWLPLIIMLALAGWYATKVRVTDDSEWAMAEFGRIPIVVQGRHMPMDTYARTALLMVRKRETANLEPWKDYSDHPKIVSAAEWALEVMVNPEVADTRPVFRIDNPDLKGMLKLSLEADPARKTDGKHYSWNDLQPRWMYFVAEDLRAEKIDSKSRSAYEEALVSLAQGVQHYMHLKITFGPAATGDLAAGLADFHKHIDAWRTAYDAQQNNKEANPADLQWGQQYREFAPLLAPREGATAGGEAIWASPFEEVLALDRGEPAPTLAAFAKMASSYRTGDKIGFATAVRSHLGSIELRPGFAADLTKASREQLLNFAEPFYWGMFLAVLAGLCGIGYWVAPGHLGWLRRTGLNILFLTLLVHTAGFVARILIDGKPPVTSLYSSAIFIGWGATVLGFILEGFFPFSIGLVVAASIEFVALWIGDFLAARDGTSFAVLEAVLNTNFWLATHVVIITLGYTATFISGFIAIIYVIFGSFTNRLSKTIHELTAEDAATAAASGRHPSDPGKPLGKILATMVYAIACFATLLSFVGTVLGGLWADQSWGRFWGWDVKENGALMIVLWNAILLHARWGGLVRDRGLMCFAIFGNVVVSWSWFGVNMLNIGLHSYGFTSGVMWTLIGFVASQLLLIVLAWVACPTSVTTAKAPTPTPHEPPAAPGIAATA